MVSYTKKDGNIWFKSTEFGDEKDRVVKRRNGQTTYFASDIAYHLNKLQRGYTDIIDIWGSDHHGYISRVKAAIDALGYDSKNSPFYWFSSSAYGVVVRWYKCHLVLVSS